MAENMIMELHEIVEVPQNTTELYKLLAKCSIVELFQNFVDEEFDDDSLHMLDPEKECFWHIIPKIVTKAGAQLRFYNELMKFQQESARKDDNYDDDDEPQAFYNSFNDKTVSIFSFLKLVKHFMRHGEHQLLTHASR